MHEVLVSTTATTDNAAGLRYSQCGAVSPEDGAVQCSRSRRRLAEGRAAAWGLPPHSPTVPADPARHLPRDLTALLTRELRKAVT